MTTPAHDREPDLSTLTAMIPTRISDTTTPNTIMSRAKHYGRAEDVAGVAIVLIILGSALPAAWEAAQKILHPEPVTNLGIVAVAAVIGFLGNELVAIYRIRVGKQIGSAALVADGTTPGQTA
jgi:Co/Zn/Cd efflux system component